MMHRDNDPDVIKKREYTYCQAFWSDPFTVRTFLVMRARGVTTADAVEAARRVYPDAGTPEKVFTYPRNYVAKARILLAKNRVTN